LTTKAFPLNKDGSARNGASVKFSAKTADGVKVDSTFESTRSGEDTKVSSKVELTSECSVHNSGFKASFSTDAQALALSYWLKNRVADGSKLQLEVKSSQSKGQQVYTVTPAVEFQNESIAAKFSAEVQPVPLSWKADVSVAGRRDALAAGFALKVAGVAVSEAAAGVAWNGTDATLTVGVAGKADATSGGLNLGGRVSWSHRVCADCDAQYGVVATVPIPSLGGSTSVAAALQWNANKDTRISAVVCDRFNAAVATRVQINDNVVLTGSTHFPLTSIVSSQGNRYFGVGLEFSA
jgi:hypothetical protein